MIGAFLLRRRLRLQRAEKVSQPETIESRYGGVQSGKPELEATSTQYSEIDSIKVGSFWGQSTAPQELNAEPATHELGPAPSIRR